MQPGTILAGRYRAGRTLGAGGMGLIVEGTHIDLGTPVAIKVLHERLAKDPERVERFLREAKAAAQLRGEHVCRVHDCGTLPGGEPFMVMELLSGCDLSALVDQLGPLTPETVIMYARQACSGVAEAHAVGIVHRDLKPTNIFRTTRPDGAPLIKILDFGLAKPMNGQDLSLTATSTVMGSPRYMSPEQLKSSKVTDPRSDIWALGVVMFELLSGKPPFDGETITELALNITNDPVPPLPETVPPRLANVVMKCLEKDAGKRYQSAAELAQALDAITKPWSPETAADTSPDLDKMLAAAASQRASSPSSSSGSGEKSKPALSLTAALDGAEVSIQPKRRVDTPWGTIDEPVKKRMSPLKIAALVALIAVGPIVYFAVRPSSPSSTPAAAAPPPPAPTPPPAPAAVAVDAAVQVAVPADAAPTVVAPDAAVVEKAAEPVNDKKKKKRRRTGSGSAEDWTKGRY